MSTRRNVKPEPNIMVRGAYRDGWPPICGHCIDPKTGTGWQGEPNDRQSPWIACGGDHTRHQRTPVTVRP